jgi:hypothetical protein
MNLQLPVSTHEPYSEAFLDGLETRISQTVRAEIRDHFDTSLTEWEADANQYADTIEDILHHRRFKAFVGLDQIVSEDAGRKAIKFLDYRTHWHISQDTPVPVLHRNHLFNGIMARRHSDQETDRARCLVARAIEAKVETYTARLAAGATLPALTQASIMTELQHAFSTDGIWGLIHIVLPHDRRRSGHGTSDFTDARAQDIIERQERWLEAAKAL